MQTAVEECEQPDHAADADQPILLRKLAQRSDRERGEDQDQRPVAGRVRDDLDRIGAQAVVKGLPQQAFQRNQRGQEDRDLCETEFHLSPDFVIPSEARNLHLAASCRSLASLGMTIYKSVRGLKSPIT